MVKIISAAFILFILIFGLFSCDADDTITAVIEDGEVSELRNGLPITLSQNFPNPFDEHGYTTITFTNTTPMHLRMRVYTDDWQEVVTLIDQNFPAAQHNVIFYGVNENGEILPAGDYFYTLESEDIILVRRMKFVRY